jgi:hypothetical protein
MPQRIIVQHAQCTQMRASWHVLTHHTLVLLSTYCNLLLYIEQQEDPREVEAAKHDLNYIGLTGNIGCMGEWYIYTIYSVQACCSLLCCVV